MSLFGCAPKRPLDYSGSAGLLWALNGGKLVQLHRDWAVIDVPVNRSERECFFERAPDRAVAGTIDNAEFYDLVLQQPQAPACASLGRLGTGQGNQLGLLLAVKNPSNGRHRARLAAQHGLEAFFHQLFAHPVNHGWAGFQSFDDPVVAPPFASFRDISLQQDPRLQYPARRALSFRISVSIRSRSSPVSLTTYFFTEIS